MFTLLDKFKFKVKKSIIGTFSGNEVINDSDFLEIKTALIEADVGIKYADIIVKEIQNYCHKKGIVKRELMQEKLKEILIKWLEPASQTWQANTMNQHETILVFGINGAGKTTTIAKIASILSKNKKIALVAGDTFRAAAIEQLDSWGKELKVEVIKPSNNSNCASIIYDSIKTTKEQNYDLIIADTSGRLQNRNDLMQELEKVVRVCAKADLNAPQHRWLVIDGTLGLNNIEQAKVFHEHLNITGLIITKLDSSAKAGAIFAITKEIQVPILFITTGEKISDIAQFNANQFVEAFFI